LSTQIRPPATSLSSRHARIWRVATPSLSVVLEVTAVVEEILLREEL
jgi:hypothetical protein